MTSADKMILGLALIVGSILVVAVILFSLPNPSAQYVPENGSRSFSQVTGSSDFIPSETEHKPLWIYKAGGPVYSVALSADGAYIGAGKDSPNSTTGITEGRIIYLQKNGSLLWDQRPDIDLSSYKTMKSLALSEDGYRIAALIDHGWHYTVACFVRNGTLVSKFGTRDWMGKNIVTDKTGQMIVSSGTKEIVSTDPSGNARWRYTTGGLGGSKDSQDFTGVHVAISGDGQHIAAVSEDSYLYYLDYQNGNLLWKYDTGHSLQTVAMSYFGRYIAAASRNHNIYYFNDDGVLLWNFTLDGVPETVAINEDGRFLAVGSDDNSISILDRNGTLIREFKTGGPVESVAISRDGQTIIAGSDDDTIYCLDRTGSLLWNYTTGGIVKSVAVSSDGQYIVAGSYDGNLYFFNRDRIDNT